MQKLFYTVFLNDKTAAYYGLFNFGFAYMLDRRYFDRLGLKPFVNNFLTAIRPDNKGSRSHIKQLSGKAFSECGNSRFELLMAKTGLKPATTINNFSTVLPFSQFVKLEHSDAFVKQQSIKNNILISSYRGVRHTTNLPIRGQRTHTNAKTRRKRKVF